MPRDIFEEVRPANTQEEMRVELFRLEHFNPLVRSVADMAHYKGLSGEDKYTVLAYHALKQLVDLQRNYFKNEMMKPREYFIPKQD